jgi:hypothetical protein
MMESEHAVERSGCLVSSNQFLATPLCVCVCGWVWVWVCDKGSRQVPSDCWDGRLRAQGSVMTNETALRGRDKQHSVLARSRMWHASCEYVVGTLYNKYGSYITKPQARTCHMLPR